MAVKHQEVPVQCNLLWSTIESKLREINDMVSHGTLKINISDYQLPSDSSTMSSEACSACNELLAHFASTTYNSTSNCGGKGDDHGWTDDILSPIVLNKTRGGLIEIIRRCRVNAAPPHHDLHSSAPQFSPLLVLALGTIFGIVFCSCYCITFSQHQVREDGYIAEALDGPDEPTQIPLQETWLDSQTFSQDDINLMKSLQVDERHLVRSGSLARGAHGEVFLGAYGEEPVAIKSLLTQQSPADILGMIDEIKILSSIHHRYIVSFIGVSFSQMDTPCIVEELMNQGDLRQHLILKSPNCFSWTDKLVVAWSIVKALIYLHELNIIHHDLKSRNILLDSKKGVKLTDFGASHLQRNNVTKTKQLGTYRWMAPEVFQGRCYSTAADIYSFGIVLTELDSHRIPYTDMESENGQILTDAAIMPRVVAGTIKPAITSTCPRWVQDMIMSCIAIDPNARPTALELSRRIRYQVEANIRAKAVGNED